MTRCPPDSLGLRERFHRVLPGSPGHGDDDFRGRVQALEALAVANDMQQYLHEQAAQIRASGAGGPATGPALWMPVSARPPCRITSPTGGITTRSRRRLGVASDQTLYVGDSETDVETARNAGVPIILVPFGYSLQPAARLGGDRLINHFFGAPRRG